MRPAGFTNLRDLTRAQKATLDSNERRDTVRCEGINSIRFRTERTGDYRRHNPRCDNSTGTPLR